MPHQLRNAALTCGFLRIRSGDFNRTDTIMAIQEDVQALLVWKEVNPIAAMCQQVNAL